MNRTEFDRALRRGIRGLPKADIQRFSEYYAEMLDDRIESGMTEEAAVAQLGDPAAIAAQILSDTSLPEVKRWQDRLMRRPHAWEVVLIVLGSPVWLSLALALFSVALALFVVMWSLIVVIWAMELAFALSALAESHLELRRFFASMWAWARRCWAAAYSVRARCWYGLNFPNG